MNQYNVGDRVSFNTGLISGVPNLKTGVITEIDGHGCATIERDDGLTSYRDLCALTKANPNEPTT